MCSTFIQSEYEELNCGHALFYFIFVWFFLTLARKTVKCRWLLCALASPNFMILRFDSLQNPEKNPHQFLKMHISKREKENVPIEIAHRLVKVL